MGPVVTPEAPRPDRRADRHRARQQGASVVVDGRGLGVDGPRDGFFVGPTLVDHVTPEMDVYTRGDLRPGAVACCALDDVDEAIDLINANPYGNGTAIFTSSGEAARALPARRTRRA